MKRCFLLLLSIIAMETATHAQVTVKGAFLDTLNYISLQRTSVVFLNTKDSVIVNFTRSHADGKFEITLPKEGKYLMRATFPGFAEYIDEINVSKKETDLGNIALVSKQHILKEFVLTKQYAAIKIKGDTTEYVADSFLTKENATVEDLLKKLPGIQVDKSGKITAQGTEVQKILVDGEEFFSDDPKVVTRGLQANTVDKVQVFDKKSEQAEFTGIDDGEKTRTINLELKEDKKKGYFGKLDGGAGTDQYFQNQGMVNSFKSKRQVSAFGIVSNTDKAGLDWGENEKYGGSNANTTVSEDGGIYSFVTGGDNDLSGWDGKYEGEGFPKTWTGGAHYANKWNEDKTHLSTNYRFGRQNVEMNGLTTTQYTLPNNGGFIQQSGKTQFSTSDRNSINVVFDQKIDSNTNIKLSVSGGNKQMKTVSDFNTVSKNIEEIATNNNARHITGDIFSNYLNADLLFRHKFAKKGRTISLSVTENYKASINNGYLKSTVSVPGYYDAITNQKKELTNGTLEVESKATYTEPISKKSFLEFNYTNAINNSYANNLSYDTSLSEKYDVLNDTFSSKYDFNILTNKGGLNYKYNGKQVTITVGGAVSQTNYLQRDNLFGSKAIERSFFNLFPQANFKYKLGKQTSLSLNYNGSTQQPTITQIQPLRQNTDPLNQVIGNPNLKQEFNHNVGLYFNDYKMLTNRYTWANVNFTAVNDEIVTNQITSISGNTLQYVNTNGNYSLNFSGGGGVKVKKTDIYIGGQLSARNARYNNFVNDTANISYNNTYKISPYINYSKEDKYDFNISPSVSYRENKSSISTFSNSYWMFDCEISASVELPKKIEIGSTANFMFREKTAVFNQNNNVILWNAYVEKKFLKKEQLTIRLSANDLLNQNLGYTRNANGSIITENRYATIRRYGMLNLIWNFKHTPINEEPKSEGTIIVN